MTATLSKQVVVCEAGEGLAESFIRELSIQLYAGSKSRISEIETEFRRLSDLSESAEIRQN
ncbi:MAG: hypothetical protein ACK528_13325, partial [Alphaproteobacteria bacterium]